MSTSQLLYRQSVENEDGQGGSSSDRGTVDLGSDLGADHVAGESRGQKCKKAAPQRQTRDNRGEGCG